MSDVTVTVRLPKALRDRLEAIGTATHRSKSYLAKMAIDRFVETEAEIIEGIEVARDELRIAPGVPHDEAMRRIRVAISAEGKHEKPE